jgi:hypothetical protein
MKRLDDANACIMMNRKDRAAITAHTMDTVTHGHHAVEIAIQRDIEECQDL